MIRFSVKMHFAARKLESAIERGERLGLRRAGFAIRQAAIKSIKTAPGASAPGSAPNTRRGLLRKSILYALEREAAGASVVVGPSHDLIGLAGKAHEFGGAFRGDEFDARPFMRPAAELVSNKLPGFFAGTVRGNA